MESSKNTIIYTDYNCPFCFALHEQARAEGLLDKFEWRLIQHAPSASSSITTYEDRAELSDEVVTVRKRASNVHISLPSFRPNTELATKLTVAAFIVDQEKASILRTLIYQAYWQDGLDVSKRSVLDPIIKRSGFDEVILSEIVDAIVTHYQMNWEQGDFARRIPSMKSVEGNVFLGFPSLAKLKGFLETNDVDSIEDDLACKLRDKQVILFVHEGSEVAIEFRRGLCNEFDIEDTLDGAKAIQLCELDNAPDLVLIDCSSLPQRGFAICRELLANDLTLSLPVIAITNNYNSEDEIKYFDLGASDYITYSVNHTAIRSRLRTHLRLRRTSILLEKLVKVDPLTKIPNRREFDRIYEQEWQRAVRNQNSISVLMIDVDNFKLFNENYGHQAGDEALKVVAKCLEESLFRAGDSVFRYGGEEFVVILPQQDDISAMTVAQRIKDSLKSVTLTLLPSEETITLSQGICSLIPERNCNPLELVKLADTALNQAKRNGKDQFICYSNQD